MGLARCNPLKARGIHVAMVTVAAYVQPGSVEAAGVADAFWSLHSTDVAGWRADAAYPEAAVPLDA